MGLIILAHAGITPCSPEEEREIEGQPLNERPQTAEDLGLRYIWREDFPQRCYDLTAVAYRVTETREVWSGGYGAWDGVRQQLAKTVGIRLVPRNDGRSPLTAWWATAKRIEDEGRCPTERFWQLINFSDCEGTLGPSVCRALHEDFSSMRPRFGSLHRGFEFASNGFVTFHG